MAQKTAEMPLGRTFIDRPATIPDKIERSELEARVIRERWSLVALNREIRGRPVVVVAHVEKRVSHEVIKQLPRDMKKKRKTALSAVCKLQKAAEAELPRH